ncbi:MAG: fused MFS/spermidine synthase [Planctomycetes bacterium]|nr:fused MFS/spermidine synthase [Planctomycetota bacterium]
MVIEITAARIMTPYFGQTVFVWTNLIGLILAAVAVGNYFGGRLADRCRTFTPLFVLLLISGAFCLAVPFLIPSVARFFLGENLRLDEAFPVLIRGSFSTGLILFVPPVLLQGACLPFLVKAATDRSGKIGRASGAIYASSTLGSILGTFLSTYLFVEFFGSRRTFFATGLVLILVGSVGLITASSKAKAWGGGVLLLLFLLVIIGGGFPDRKFDSNDQVLFETESRYQYLKVVLQNEHPKTIHLALNEGLDSFHSVYMEGQILTDGQYYDYYCLLPMMAGTMQPHRVCIVGLAGGTSARQYKYFYDDPVEPLQIDGVEIDPMTVEVGRAYMDLDGVGDALKVFCDVDGRVFLDAVNYSYDVIIVDAYAKQVYIPFHLATREFFELAESKLRAGGILGMNVNGYSFSDELLMTITRTAASVFDSVAVARLPGLHNFMIYAVKDCGFVDPSSARLNERTALLEPLLHELSRFGVTRKVSYDPKMNVLTDDHSPIEFLCDHDLIRRAELLMSQAEASGP